MKAERALGMSIQKIRLFLQFSRRSPIIITIQQGHVLPLCQLEGLSKHSVAVASEVFRWQYETNFLGISALKIKDDRTCSIGGAVLSDNDFVIEICFLHQNTVECLRNMFFVVIRQYDYADFHVAEPSHDW